MAADGIVSIVRQQREVNAAISPFDSVQAPSPRNCATALIRGWGVGSSLLSYPSLETPAQPSQEACLLGGRCFQADNI